MKTIPFALALVFALVTSFAVKADDALGERVGKEGLFSVQAPQGWKVRPTSAVRKDFECYDPSKPVTIASHMSVMVEKEFTSLDGYVAGLKGMYEKSPNVKNGKVVSEKDFKTDTNMPGFRMVTKCTVNNKDLQIIDYGFEGRHIFFRITAVCMADDADEMAQVYDACMKTFKEEKTDNSLPPDDADK